MGRWPISAYCGGVSIDVYQAILEHAPNGTYTAAGDLHEAIWTDLLRRSDPKVHNVRVTRGDGGIDGVGFQDPVTGEARVYQAKFFQDLSDDKDAHKKAVVEAFVRAHCHPFACTSWVRGGPGDVDHQRLPRGPACDRVTQRVQTMRIISTVAATHERSPLSSPAIRATTSAMSNHQQKIGSCFFIVSLPSNGEISPLPRTLEMI
jgi:hypothetical protein